MAAWGMEKRVECGRNRWSLQKTSPSLVQLGEWNKELSVEGIDGLFGKPLPPRYSLNE